MRFKNVLCLSSTIVATVIGAGFATGQEIYSFFNRYGKWSFMGLLLVLIVFCSVFRYVLEACCFNRLDGFSALLMHLHMRKAGKWMETGVALFSFCGFCAMASASGTLVSQTLDLPYMYGVLAMLVICGVILSFDIRALAGANCVLAPVICVGLIYYALYGVLFRSVATLSQGHYYVNAAQIFVSALVYASYNLLSAVVVLCAMRRYCDSERTIHMASGISASVLVIVALLLWFVIYIYQNKIALGEIPMLQIASRGGKMHQYIYSGLLFMSVYTTAVSCGFAVLDFLRKHFRVSTGFGIGFLIVLACPVCLLGFSGIVRVLYSVFGYLGLPFLIILIFSQIKLSRKTKRSQKL